MKQIIEITVLTIIMPDCPCFIILVDIFKGIEGIADIVQGYVHYINPAGFSYLMSNNPVMNPFGHDIDIYTVWPCVGSRMNEISFIGKMEKFQSAKQEYASVRARCSNALNIKIEFTFFNGANKTSTSVQSKESLWQTLCTRKPFTLRYKIPRIQSKLLGTGSQHAADLIKDIVLWIDDEIYKKCIANGLWTVVHSGL